VIYGSRALLDQMRERFGCLPDRTTRTILWFTDTLTDLNGPSETIRKLSWLGHERNLRLVPVAAMLPGETAELPPQTVKLPAVWTFTPSFFQNYTLRVPSLLRSLKRIAEQNPDEILISTPGPVGLLGVLASRVLHVPATAIYHTDFSGQAKFILDDEQVSRAVEDYVRWFYSLCSRIKVPTAQYISILGDRGYDRTRMSLFRRGIESDLFAPDPQARDWLAATYGVAPGFTLVYAGRISTDKHMSFLAEIYQAALARVPELNLLIAGEGPSLRELRHALRGIPRAHLLGRLPREGLARVYAGSDLLVFPSTTDTFGMVVLEAQASGVPALVSNIGGPQEIIEDGQTGRVLPVTDSALWVDAVVAMARMKVESPAQFAALGEAARGRVTRLFDWHAVLDDLFGTPPSAPLPQAAPVAAQGALVPACNE
jgi:glycosyltransferase involved in cell wall biosynthesis